MRERGRKVLQKEEYTGLPQSLSEGKQKEITVK